MVPQALRMAESAFKKFKTRNPFEIMDAKHILMKDFDKPGSLLGFYTVSNRKQVIGLNQAADDVQRLTGAIHELGHSLNDYKLATASGQPLEDYRFFSMSHAPCEFNANLTGAELFIPDDYILEQIRYADYQKLLQYIGEHIGKYRSERARMQFEAEQMQEFYDVHSDIPSFEHLAVELGVDVGVVKFKFRALSYKDYDLPNIPETQSDFLKNWQRSPEW